MARAAGVRAPSQPRGGASPAATCDRDAGGPLNVLLILNDPPYGTERSYNGLRLAGSLSKREGVAVKVFLIGDAVACAKAGQTVPQSYYNIERMIRVPAQRGAEVAACGSCLDARGLKEADLAEGVRRGSLELLTDWTLWAEKIVVF